MMQPRESTCTICGVSLIITRATYGTRGESPSEPYWTHADGPAWRKARRTFGGHAPETKEKASR